MSDPAVSRWYPSKVDWWLAVILAFAPITCLVAGIALLQAGEGILIAFSGLAFILALYFGIVLPMRYSINDDVIIVRHGLVRQRIPLRDITEVRPTRSPLSSPALSLDRLFLRFGEGMFKSAMISPVDKEAFVTELATKAGLTREGDRLVRR